MEDMNELVLDFLQDIYYAEKASIRAMAKMAKAADGENLKTLITEHRKLSEQQVSRLGDVFAALGKRPRGKQCAAMDGLIHEAEEAIEDSGKGPVLDAALIACAQAMEHYEIARYGALVAWMRTMGKEDGVGVLQGILDEEKEADARYNELALHEVNEGANQTEAAEDEKEPDEEPAEPEPEPEPAPKPASRRKAPARAKKAEEPAPVAEEKPARKKPGPKPSGRAKK